MSEAALYIKAFGLSVNKKGKPNGYGGIKVKVGTFKKGQEIPYSELIEGKDPNKIIEYFGIDKVLSLSDVKFITPEEYEKEYGDEAIDTVEVIWKDKKGR